MPKVEKGRSDDKPAKTKSTSGWAEVVRRKEERDEASSSDKIPEFYMKDGETAIVQFLGNEPYCVEGCQLKVNGKWRFVPTQLTKQKYCLLMKAGHKTTGKVAFKVLDFRGTWDKEKKKFKHDIPVEKMWVTSNTVALQIKRCLDRTKHGELSQLVLEVSRVGSDKTTTYNFEKAFDRDENPIRPIKDFEEEYESVEKYLQPPTDAQLRSWGVGAEVDERDDDDEDLDI